MCPVRKKTLFSAADLYLLPKNAILESERRQKNMDQTKVGLFLKELRSEKSITQAELAELLGVSNRSISRWENGVSQTKRY